MGLDSLVFSNALFDQDSIFLAIIFTVLFVFLGDFSLRFSTYLARWQWHLLFSYAREEFFENIRKIFFVFFSISPFLSVLTYLSLTQSLPASGILPLIILLIAFRWFTLIGWEPHFRLVKRWYRENPISAKQARATPVPRELLQKLSNNTLKNRRFVTENVDLYGHTAFLFIFWAYRHSEDLQRGDQFIVAAFLFASLSFLQSMQSNFLLGILKLSKVSIPHTQGSSLVAIVSKLVLFFCLFFGVLKFVRWIPAEMSHAYAYRMVLFIVVCSKLLSLRNEYLRFELRVKSWPEQSFQRLVEKPSFHDALLWRDVGGSSLRPLDHPVMKFVLLRNVWEQLRLQHLFMLIPQFDIALASLFIFFI